VAQLGTGRVQEITLFIYRRRFVQILVLVVGGRLRLRGNMKRGSSVFSFDRIKIVMHWLILLSYLGVNLLQSG
jgi:hypothetical protein